MKKLKYETTNPITGEVATRKSHRTYTHAVWVKVKDEDSEGWYTKFSGTHDLARKAASSEKRWDRVVETHVAECTVVS